MPDFASGGVSRRTLARQAGATAVLAAASALLPLGAHAQSRGPETTKARLGYIALADAAPLLVAQELKLFAKYGMPDVSLVKQFSWNTLKRNIASPGGPEGIDGGHFMLPLAYMVHTGRGVQSGRPVPMNLLAALSKNGQGISVSRIHMATGARLDSAPLRDALVAKPGSTIASPVRWGTNDLWLRYWLAAGGIDPTLDVRIEVTPAPEMAENIRMDLMDAFSASEPWNQHLVTEGLGYTACVTGEILRDHPEKSFAMTADWVAKNPRAAVALTAAVIEAQMWADTPGNAPAVAAMLTRPGRLSLPASEILPRAVGDIDYGDGRKVTASPLRMKFWADGGSYPFQSHDLWYLTEGIRWGLYPHGTNTRAIIAAVNREDLWREAAKLADAPAGPAGTSRGVERFFDGKVFDPADPAAYLASQPIKSMVA